jgi:N-acetylmuramoyl-L-alanine amidase
MGGLNLSTVPKVMLECGNMRNSADAAKLTSAAFRQRIAASIAAGLTAFLKT